MPAAAPIIFIAGLAGIIAMLLGGKKAKAEPVPQLPPGPSPEPVPGCTLEDKQFVLNVSQAADKGTATVEMIQKAIIIARKCGMHDTALSLEIDLKAILQKQEEAKQVGVVKITDVKAKGDGYVCGVVPGKGYACRPRSTEEGKDWRSKAKRFQNALNIAAIKLPGPAETPKLLKVDGRIGNKTQHLLDVVAKRIELPGFDAFKNVVAASRPEDTAGNLTFLTRALTVYVQKKAGSGPAVSGIGHYGMTHSAPIPGVTEGQWVEFVKCMRGRGGKKGIGPFKIRPLEMRKYNLVDEGTGMEAQYKNFAKYMRALAAKILANPQLRGAVEAGELTLSGLLALCKQAGPKGAVSWLQNPEDRERFPNTTEAVETCNGIF